MPYHSRVRAGRRHDQAVGGPPPVVDAVRAVALDLERPGEAPG
ncbi:hypothetical protein [Microbispora bryophytorum]|nr:hypothetical protein [Microbispora camponoti]